MFIAAYNETSPGHIRNKVPYVIGQCVTNSSGLCEIYKYASHTTLTSVVIYPAYNGLSCHMY